MAVAPGSATAWWLQSAYVYGINYIDVVSCTPVSVKWMLEHLHVSGSNHILPAELSQRSRPGPKPSPDKRAAMLGEAAKLFAARGMEGTTTREVAAAAGTTERTLFKHFGSKNGLIQAVIEEVAVPSMAQATFGRVHDPRPFTADEFKAWHREFLLDRVLNAGASPEGYRILFRELLGDESFRMRFGSQWLAAVFKPLSAHLARMQENGEIRSRESPEALAGVFFSLNLGYLVSRFVLAPDHAWNTNQEVAAIVNLSMAACEG